MLKKLLVLLFSFPILGIAQTDTTANPSADEDYSQYDSYNFVDQSIKKYCTSKVFDLSPSKLISVGYDFQGGYDLTTDTLFNPTHSSSPYADQNTPGFGSIQYSHGLRLAVNIPVISNNAIIVQLGANYAEQRYKFNQLITSPSNDLINTLKDNGLRTTGLNTTIFKPFNEKSFLLLQASADLSGDYGFNSINLKYLRSSVAAIWGQKKGDRKMIGFGLSRTYRVGEMNYIPVFLLNYTAPNRKNGCEILFPARVHYRRTFSARSLALFGYELEGQSYRLGSRDTSPALQDIELRRGELRIRAVYERSISSFLWLSAQAGFRYNYSFDADRLPEGKEFFRGFFGDQPYAMQNTLGNTFYFLVGVNLVSP
jgi:hypothetical protein